MNRSLSLEKFAPAFIKARGEFAPIKRNKDVTITGERRSYSFKYAPLDEIQAATDPALRSNGLCVIQNIGGSAITTMVLHETGEYIETDPIPLNGNLYGTQFGAEVTYKRRYQLAGALNVAIEDDTDAPEVNALNQPDKKIRPTTKITPTAGAFAALTSVVQEQLRTRAASITEAFYNVGAPAAFDTLQSAGITDADTRVALWSLLDSKTRSAIKKHELLTRQPEKI